MLIGAFSNPATEWVSRQGKWVYMRLLGGSIADCFRATERSPEDGPHTHSATIARLGTHCDIGWDFDGTLVGHRASPILHEFIRTRRAIRHVIVTFRAGSAAERVWDDLARYETAPDRSCFAQVLSIPNESISEYVGNRERLGLMRHVLSSSDAEQQCRNWKGQVCFEHDLTALVDDMTGFVAAGCHRHNVTLFHPDEFVADRAARYFAIPMWRSRLASPYRPQTGAKSDPSTEAGRKSL
jgi:hypothetical protein